MTARTRSSRVRVRYAETDRMGVVYYANYFVWFEVGRTDWLRDAGWTYRQMEKDGVALPVIRVLAAGRRWPGSRPQSNTARRTGSMATSDE